MGFVSAEIYVTIAYVLGTLCLIFSFTWLRVLSADKEKSPFEVLKSKYEKAKKHTGTTTKHRTEVHHNEQGE